MSLLAILGLGFLLGMRHATDPDHVIAVSTIVTRHRTAGGAALIGAVWGLGHTLTILVVGSAIILFGWVIPERVGLSLELAVAGMLVALGILTLRDVLRAPRPATVGSTSAGHSHPHQHGDYVHTHAHEHNPESHPHRPDQTPLGWLDRRLGRAGIYQWTRPLLIGVVHGLAGSAAVALLILTMIGDSKWSVFYLMVYGAGTIAGMMLITAAIALPFRYRGRWSGRFTDSLRLGSGLVSLGFGFIVMYQIGFVQGLFTGR